MRRCTRALTTPPLLGQSGAVDPNFGINGVMTHYVDVGGNWTDISTAVALQSDATSPRSDCADGTLDPAFGSGGLISYGFDRSGDFLDVPTALDVRPDGRMLVTGSVQFNAAGDWDFGIAQFLP